MEDLSITTEKEWSEWCEKCKLNTRIGRTDYSAGGFQEFCMRCYTIRTIYDPFKDDEVIPAGTQLELFKSPG